MAAVYTTESDVKLAAGMENNVTVTDAYVLTKIEMAQGVIDGKVGDVYAVPFTTVPDMIKAIALNLSVAMLYIDQYGDEVEGNGVDGQKLFDNTMDTLDMIQKQKIKLRDSAGDEYTRRDLFTPSGYPTQATTDDGTTTRAFTADKVF